MRINKVHLLHFSVKEIFQLHDLNASNLDFLLIKLHLSFKGNDGLLIVKVQVPVLLYQVLSFSFEFNQFVIRRHCRYQSVLFVFRNVFNISVKRCGCIGAGTFRRCRCLLSAERKLELWGLRVCSNLTNRRLNNGFLWLAATIHGFYE